VALQSDVLVIGSGLAGMLCALRCAEHGRILLVTKDQLPESSSRYAQGGIASVWGEDDTFESHIEDTLTAGAGLCRRDAVETVVREGPDRVREVIALGVHFDVNADSEHPSYDLGREGGHSHRRILHALDQTGGEMVRALGEAVRASANVQLLENHLAVELIVDRRGGTPACWGAYILDKTTGRIHRFLARATILCTGGSGKVYLYTSNPDVATGDGLAMGYRAGARVADMEFFQFHPTCLYHPQAKSFLLTEALRGEGAVLRRPDGERFMPSYHPLAELAPRDVVARAIDSEMKQHGYDCVYLDISHRDPDWVRTRFPNVYRRCLEFGFDLAKQPVPAVPAAHYQCGGLVTDLDGQTSIGRLYAAGEVACTGLHGANRLASNSLLEALVFGHRAARHVIALLRADRTPPPPHPPWEFGAATVSTEHVVVSQDWDEIRRFMWNYVGIVRSNQRLERAAKRISLLQDEIQSYYWNVLPSSDLVELRNIATVAELIIACASLRRESRGLHTTIDYPEPRASEQHDTVIQRGDSRTPSALPPGSWRAP
jgi:L-aspartate oxidase